MKKRLAVLLIAVATVVALYLNAHASCVGGCNAPAGASVSPSSLGPYFTTATADGNSGARKQIDFTASAIHTVTINASTELYFTAPTVSGVDLTLIMTNSGTGYSIGLPASPEVSTLTTVADSGGSLDGLYFRTYDSGGSVCWWIDVDNGGGSAPAGTCATSTRTVEINTIATGDSANTVATAVAAAIDADAQYTATASTNTVTLVDVSDGARTDISAGTSTFTAAVTFQGSASVARFNGSPAWDTTSGAVNILRCFYDGTDYICTSGALTVDGPVKVNTDNTTLTTANCQGLNVLSVDNKTYTLPANPPSHCLISVATAAATYYFTVAPNTGQTITGNVNGSGNAVLSYPLAGAAGWQFSWSADQGTWVQGVFAISRWNTNAYFRTGQIVFDGTNWFIAMQDNNGHTPSGNDAYWHKIDGFGVTAQDEGGGSLGTFTNINCVGAGIACTDGGSGTFTMTVSGGGTGVSILSSTTGVDMKTVAQTTLYTCPVGKTCVITDVILIGTSVTVGGGAAPVARVGKAAAYDEFCGNMTLSHLTWATGRYQSLRDECLVYLTVLQHTTFAAGDVIKLDVTTGSTYTTFTAQVDVIGYTY